MTAIYDDVMIDLETMGTAVNSPIVAVGAVYFDRFTGRTGERFYECISMDDAFRNGRASGDTVSWWMRQSDAARSELTAGKLSSLEALSKFRTYLKLNESCKPWGNGSSFDISMLDVSFPRVTGSKGPWAFWRVRDCRTVLDIAEMCDLTKHGERGGTHHNALDDAIYQAEWVSHYLMQLRAQSQSDADLFA